MQFSHLSYIHELAKSSDFGPLTVDLFVFDEHELTVDVIMLFVLYQNNVLMLEMMVISKFSDCLRTNHFWASVHYSEAS